MNHRWYKISLIFIFVMAGLIGKLFGQLTIESELRPRAEYRDGYKQPASPKTDPATFISQRSRLALYYTGTELDYGFSIQDIRVWGDETQFSPTGITGDAASLDLSEAWLSFSVSQNIKFKLGRQIFKYDDERILSGRNWNQNGQRYNAILISWKKKSGALDAAFSLNNEGENTFNNFYDPGKIKTLNFIRYELSLPAHLKMILQTMATGFTPNDSSEVLYLRGTYSALLQNKVDKHDLTIAAYYQNGRNKSGRNVSAYLLTADALFRARAFTYGGGLVYLSGQDGLNANPGYRKTDHLFDIFYGARHGYYGSLDYFNNLPKSTAGGGLIDYFLTASYTINSDSFIRLNLHRFELQNRVADPVIDGQEIGALDRFLGYEADLSLKHELKAGISLDGGYSRMWSGQSLRKLQGVTTNERSHWFWLMLTMKIRLFPADEAKS